MLYVITILFRWRFPFWSTSVNVYQIKKDKVLIFFQSVLIKLSLSTSIRSLTFQQYITIISNSRKDRVQKISLCVRFFVSKRKLLVKIRKWMRSIQSTMFSSRSRTNILRGSIPEINTSKNTNFRCVSRELKKERKQEKKKEKKNRRKERKKIEHVCARTLSYSVIINKCSHVKMEVL